MKVVVASDHAGHASKARVIELLDALGFEASDLGPDSAAPVDYPDYAGIVSKAVQRGDAERGILICGSGIGMAMAANRHRGIRAVAAVDCLQARLARQHNDANVLCLGARLSGTAAIEEIIRMFFTTDFEGGRHLGRVKKIDGDLDQNR